MHQTIDLELLALFIIGGLFLRSDHGLLGSRYQQTEFLEELHFGIADDVIGNITRLGLGLHGGNRALQHYQQLGILCLDAVIGLGILPHIQLTDTAAIIPQEQQNGLIRILHLIRELYIAFKGGVKNIILQLLTSFNLCHTKNLLEI